MSFLTPCDDPQVKYHSSISQHKNTFSVMRRGEWIPISFDSLDWIDCNHIEHHPAYLTDGDDLGFNYDVKDCYVLTQSYVFHDEHQIEMKPLPSWCGFGFYSDVLNEQSLISANNASLGETNILRLRIGTNYAISDRILPAVE